MRTFEAAGCGAFLLSDYVGGMENAFDIGKEIACYKSEDEMVEKVRYYLDHPELRNQIALAGQRRAYQEHSFENRIKQILAL